jgi:DNA polymerase-3 subunit gamma/tau
MSYEPLHHKYRPKSFAGLVGQEAIATTLTNAIQTSRIANAYLFTGPRGTGKTSSARILAKSLNCLSSPHPTATPCEKCEACLGITKGYAVDVIEIDAASNTGVDNIREIIERSQFAPIQCRYKVYVVDECHMLSTQAFNALLKTLEEPPKHIVFVLATTDPQRVLPTIISRCQRFDFRRIPLDSMVKHLTHISSEENINISEEAIILIAQLAQGGLRDAESLLDQLSLLPGEVIPDRVWDLVGSVSEKDLLSLLNALAADNAEFVIDSTRKILDRGREPLIILQNLAGFYRDLLIAKTAPSRGDLVAATQETWQNLINFAQKFEISAILAGQNHLRSAEVQLKNTTQPRLWLEVTLLGLLPSAQQQVITTTNIAPASNRQPTNYQQPPANQPVHQQPPTNQPPANQPVHQQPPTNQPPANQPVHQQPQTNQPPTNQPVHQQPQTNQPPTNQPVHQPLTTNNEQDLTQVWQLVLSNLEPVSRRELLRQMCHVVELKEKTARLGIKQAWFKRAQADLSIITAAFKSAFGREIQVDLEVASAPEARNQRSSAQSAKASYFSTTPTNNGNGSNSEGTKGVTRETAQTISIENTPQQDAVSPAAHTNGNGNGNTTLAHELPVILAEGVEESVSSASSPDMASSIIQIDDVAKPGLLGVENAEPVVSDEVISFELEPLPLPDVTDANVEKVIYAAERLAQFFDGQVIAFGEDATGFSDALSADISIDVVEDDD